MAPDMLPTRPPFMSQLVATLISPVVAFYAGGCLLSFGYFQGISPALLTAFTPTELAMAGLSRITASLASLSLFFMFMAVIASVVSRRLSASGPNPAGDRLVGILCILNTAVMVVGMFSMGFFSGLLGILAIMLAAVIGGALLLGSAQKVREWLRPCIYFLIPIGSLLGLLALGEASFKMAMTGNSAEKIGVSVNGVTREATLMVLGSGAMVYHLDNCFYVSGPRGENPLKVNCQQQSLPARS